MTMRAALGAGRAEHRRRPAPNCAVWLACSQIPMADSWRCIACSKAAESRKLARFVQPIHTSPGRRLTQNTRVHKVASMVCYDVGTIRILHPRNELEVR